MVFHVDYWDYLGWKDPFSKPEFTERQRAYAKFWGSKQVYTPMFVLNGLEWRHHANKNLDEQQKSVGRLSVDVGEKKDHFRISFSPEAKLPVALRLHHAVLANDVETSVTAGENSGKILKHDFLVLQKGESQFPQKNGVFTTEIFLQKKFENPPGQNLFLVFWVTTKTNPVVIQALGGKL